MAHESPAPSAESQAFIGYGSHFQILDESVSPDAYVDLGEVFNITPPSATVDQIDVTHMQSPGRRREFIDGLIDPGECSFEMNYIPDSAGDNLLNAILDTPIGESRRRTCRIIYPNAVIHQFSANLMTYEPTLPTDDKATASVAFRVTGLVARGSVDSPPT
jgi:predicted secreted protein